MDAEGVTRLVEGGTGRWERRARRLAEGALIERETREMLLLTTNANERLEWFLNNRPGLAHRLREHHIAAFLGITPVSLSRLRRRRREAAGALNPSFDVLTDVETECYPSRAMKKSPEVNAWFKKKKAPAGGGHAARPLGDAES